MKRRNTRGREARKQGGARRVGAGASGIAVLLAASGCATSPDRSAADEVNNGLSHLAAEQGAEIDPIDEMNLETQDNEARIAAAMRAYTELFDTMGTDSTDASAAESPATPDPAPEAPTETPVADEAAPGEDAELPEPEQPEPTPEERARALASELEAVLRESADDPYVLAIRLAGLLAGEDDASARLSGVIARLPAEQRAVAEAVAEIVGAAGVSADGDPQRLIDALVAQAERLDEARPVRIGALRLCSRVEGFGRYTELPTTSFVAGSPMRMIIYTEVEHFDRRTVSARDRTRSEGSGYRPPSVSTGDDEWEVRLSMELQLYHEADGLLAWRRPEEVTVYRSKAKVRDFFVIDQVELPRRLTVGAYRLKVILRDLADRSVDERLVPIRVVADPELTEPTTTTGG